MACWIERFEGNCRVMPGNKDGGLWALGGYLYQTVGILGISAQAKTLHLDNVPEDDLNLLFSLLDINGSPNFRVEAERYGEDALIRNFGVGPEDHCVLVQFKYSRTNPPRTIGPEDLRNILTTFEENVRRAERSGLQVTACVLITNRTFAEGPGRGEQLWQDELVRPRHYRLRRVLNASLEYFIEILEDFARCYGATDSEIERGINGLIGRTIFRGEEQQFDAGVFKNILVEYFTGSLNAHPVSLLDLSERLKEDLREYGTNNLSLDRWNFVPIKRKAYDKLIELVGQRALVGLYGPGGCGKSVLLWQLLWQIHEYAICKLDPASDIVDEWVSKIVNHHCRNLPLADCPNETTDVSIRRLITANPGIRKPIFWLGLDGLDEDIALTDQKAQIHSVVRWFWRHDLEIQKDGGLSDAVLIITCRNKDQLREIIGLAPDRQEQFPKMVYVNEFDKEEAFLAMQQNFPDRISQNYSSPFERDPSSPHSFPGVSPDQEEFKFRAKPIILNSLSHPIIWRALLSIDDLETRESILDGNNQALMLLATRVLDWFNYKVQKRNRGIGLLLDEVVPLLAQVAKQTQATELMRRQIWLNALQSHGENLAQVLFKESEQGGLIDWDSDLWHWKHRFIHDYLLTYQG